MLRRQQRSILYKWIPPGTLVVSLLWIYLATIAPSLTWAHDGSDGGDLIAATASRGIAHPSGYPLYMLLARGFQLLPVGSLAFRTNLMSTVFAVSASMLVYALVVRYLREEVEPYRFYLAGLSAGYATGLSPLLWSQALITEVYTLHAFFIVLIIYLIAANISLAKRTYSDRLQGVVYGLAATNHLTSLLVIPSAILAGCFSRFSAKANPKVELCEENNYGFDWKSAFRQFAWMLVGLSIYLILPIRAMSQPVINWGNPVNLRNFWWLVSGQVYRSYYLQDGLIHLWPRIQSVADLLLHQFGLIGIALGFIGLVMAFKPSRLYFLTIWAALIFSIVTVTYQSNDAYVYFIPVAISFSIWIGLGVSYIVKYLMNWHKVWVLLFALVLLINFGFEFLSNWQAVDASNDHRAENFGEQVLTVAPENALIFAEGDRATFALWYFHFALGKRPDVSVIATDLLHWDWYLESLRTTYPSLNLETLFPWASTIVEANPDRPACFVRYTEQTEILCDEN